MITVTEADRATARRVIRRHVGLSDLPHVVAAVEDLDEHWAYAALAAAQGRAYAAALRGAK